MGFGFGIRGDARNLDPIGRRIVEQCSRASSRAVRAAAMQTRSRIVTLLRFNQSRYSTGHLVRSVSAEIYAQGGDVTYAAVGTPVEYSRYLEDGTQRHWVAPVRAKCLAWRLRTGLQDGRKWIGAAFHKAAKSGKWSGWGRSRGHWVSGIRAWRVFHDTRVWLSGALPAIVDAEARKVK